MRQQHELQEEGSRQRNEDAAKQNDGFRPTGREAALALPRGYVTEVTVPPVQDDDDATGISSLTTVPMDYQNINLYPSLTQLDQSQNEYVGDDNDDIVFARTNQMSGMEDHATSQLSRVTEEPQTLDSLQNLLNSKLSAAGKSTGATSGPGGVCVASTSEVAAHPVEATADDRFSASSTLMLLVSKEEFLNDIPGVPDALEPDSIKTCQGQMSDDSAVRQATMKSLTEDGIPGAYACARGDTRTRLSSGVGRPEGTEIDASGSHSMPIASEEDGLVHAKPIGDAQDLPSATEVTANKSDRTQPKDLCPRAIFYPVIFALLCVVGLVILVALVSRGSNNRTHEQASNTQSDFANEDPHSTGVDLGSWEWDLPFDIPNTTLHQLHKGILRNETTYITKAYDWIREDILYNNTHSEATLLQRFALAMFFYASQGEDWMHRGGDTVSIKVLGTDLASIFSPEAAESTPTKPTNFTITSNPWLSHVHSECTWYSTATVRRSSKLCNDDGQLEHLSLLHNNLHGILPDELSLLTALKSIELEGNELRGQLSSELSKFTNLEVALLRRNHFESLPSEIGLLSNTLKLFSLGDSVSGTLPYECWHGLPKLEEVRAGNMVVGAIPSNIGSLWPRLKLLLLRGNQFSGSLPSSLGLMTDLFNIAAGQNRFSGTIPSQVGMLSNLTRLFVSGNSLTGELPSELGLLSSNLRELWVEGNAGINGTIPDSFVHLNNSLVSIKMKSTNITGTIPEALCGIKVLSFDCSLSLCGCECPCQ